MMKDFQEIFNQYKKGAATPEEQQLIEAELTKQRLLEEYLAQEEFAQSFWEPVTLSEESTVDTTFLRKKTNRKILTFAIIPAILVVVTLIGIFFWYTVVDPKVKAASNAKYFNPNSGLIKKENALNQGQAFLDFTVYTNLFIPGKVVNDVTATNTGIGQYELNVGFSDVFNLANHPGTFYTGFINKNKLKDTSMTNTPLRALGNIIYRGYSYHFLETEGDVPTQSSYQREGNQENDELVRKELSLLPESSWVSAYISFKDDLSLDVFQQQIKTPDLTIPWVAVRNAPAKEMQAQQVQTQIGFQYDQLIGYYHPESPPLPEDLYPHLISNLNLSSPTDFETHFLSQLRYLIDRREFMEVIQTDPSAVSYGELLKSQAYIDTNGVKTYGALIQGSVSEVLTTLENPHINGFTIDNAKLSNFSH